MLEKSFGVKVINYEKIDKKGEVYRSPTSVEIDVIIHDGQVILCEISASFSRDDVEGFARKIKFYEKHEKKKVSRAIIISPMIGSKAIDQAKVYSIETYTYPDKSVLKI
ncbi:MAG: hypothetical protein FVQ77_03065 [Cytophagales bacterium]|nr:hypothetical protein [Cytophagales bacterium]